MIPPLSGAQIPDTFHPRADELRARAANERGLARQKYLRGLASSCEELSRQHGERPSSPSRPLSREQIAGALRPRCEATEPFVLPAKVAI